MKNPAEIFLPKGRNLWAQFPKSIKERIIFKKDFSSKFSKGNVEWTFDHPAKNFPTKRRKCFADCSKMMWKNDFFLKKIISLKWFLWRGRMNFWQPCWKTFDKRPKCFCSKSTRDTKKQNFWGKTNACNEMNLLKHRRENFKERA